MELTQYLQISRGRWGRKGDKLVKMGVRGIKARIIHKKLEAIKCVKTEWPNPTKSTRGSPQKHKERPSKSTRGSPSKGNSPNAQRAALLSTLPGPRARGMLVQGGRPRPGALQSNSGQSDSGVGGGWWTVANGRGGDKEAQGWYPEAQGWHEAQPGAHHTQGRTRDKGPARGTGDMAETEGRASRPRSTKQHRAMCLPTWVHCFERCLQPWATRSMGAQPAPVRAAGKLLFILGRGKGVGVLELEALVALGKHLHACTSMKWWSQNTLAHALCKGHWHAYVAA